MAVRFRPELLEIARLMPPIILFDGVCQFCNRSVNFLLDHDTKGVLRFAALQSNTGQQLLKRFGLPTTRLGTLVLVEGDHYWLRSTAALRIAMLLGGWWKYLAVFLLFPWFLRDFAYDILAVNRYRWFGKVEACRMPTPELRERFLD
jgi:predicted DCC family thiol-disulfide oxidoreductase YuxK